jgi:hypothetical protein
MKRKIQHNAVNNQEDEDSCAYSIRFPGDAPVEKKREEGSDEESSDQLSSEAPGSMDKSISNRE